MTFKEFAKAAFLFPAKVFGGITSLLLGSYKRRPDAEIITDAQGNPSSNRGLLGSILDGFKYVGRGTSNFLYNHRQAIAVAFWASLVLAGAAALTVFLWPAALTAVTTFTIAGLSIAGVVGANVVAQIGAVAALTAAATSVAVYTAAAVANTISAISTFFASRSTPRQRPSNEENLNVNGSAKQIRVLGAKVTHVEDLTEERSPVHSQILKSTKGKGVNVDEEVRSEHVSSVSNSN